MKNEIPNQPKVSVITINYNQAAVTCDFLESMRKISYKNVEIIVVDNHSEREDPSIIQEKYPEVLFVSSSVNLGFAGGNNLGLNKATGKYFLFINNDTEVAPNFMEPMVKLLEQNQEIGMVSPKIRYFDFPDTIQYAGYNKMNPFTFRVSSNGFNEKDTGLYDKIQETYFAHGCAMMTSTKVVEEVGPMWEGYFLYYEEHDWSSTIREAGYKIYYQPESLVYHKESISVGKDNVLKVYYHTRNRIIYFRRHSKGLSAFFTLLYMIFVSIPKNFIVYLLRGDMGHLRAFIKGVTWHLKLNKIN